MMVSYVLGVRGVVLVSVLACVSAQSTTTAGGTAATTSGTITAAPSTVTLPAGPPLPLTDYTFTYPNLPYQVEPQPSGRGPQSGYNICNATTEGPNSLCQTMFVNSIDDFCIWGAQQPNSVVGNVEGEVVAYCTKPGHGTRLIPPGALTAVQFIKAPGYIQVTGLLDQTGIDLAPDDSGGELDPHGADLAGNPLGGLVFSNNLPTTSGSVVQVNNWNNFIGSNQFCIKACDNSITNPDYCQNVYDTQGCGFNMPAAYAPGVFLSCLGDNQNAPGGDPVIPATSSCTTYTSSLLYAASSASSARASSSTKSTSATAARTSGTASASGNSHSGAVVVHHVDASVFAIVSTIAVTALAGFAVLL